MLYVSNAGLGNGVSREHVYSWLSGYGSLVDIIMVERKPYCFVVTADVAGAQRMASLGGSKVEHEGITQPVEHFIHYVSEGGYRSVSFLSSWYVNDEHLPSASLLSVLLNIYCCI